MDIKGRSVLMMMRLVFHHRPYVVVGVAIRGGGRGVGRVVVQVRMMAYLLLLLNLFHEDGLFLVFASLVLEPDADDSRRQARHLHQLLLHQGVGTRIGRVAGAQRVQLFLVQYCTNSRRFAVRSTAAAAATGDATRSTDATHSAFSFTIARPSRSFAALLSCRRRDASIGTICFLVFFLQIEIK